MVRARNIPVVELVAQRPMAHGSTGMDVLSFRWSTHVVWICPVAGCGRRVAVLYGRRQLACRMCSGLVFGSQRETAADRAIRRANGLRRRLGWEPGIVHGGGEKPKGMQWRTYWRLRDKHGMAANEAFAGAAGWLESQRTRIVGRRGFQSDRFPEV
jgi:hypothetical protein